MKQEVIALSLYPGIELGFTFPNEIEEGINGSIYYALLSNIPYKLEEVYNFKALLGETEIDTKLIRYSNIYKVSVENHGQYLFRPYLVNEIFNRYIGSMPNPFKNKYIHLLECLNFQELEFESRKSGLCFVGSILT